MQTIQRLKAELTEVKEQNRLLRNGSSDDAEGSSESAGDTSTIKDVQESNVTDPVTNKLADGVNSISNQVSVHW